MSYLFAKVKHRSDQNKIRKILHTDQVLYRNIEELVIESIPYSQNSLLDDGVWYSINKFSSSEYSIEILTKEINSAEYDRLTREEYKHMVYIFSLSSDRNNIFFQRVGKAALVEEKRIEWLDNQFIYNPESTSLLINQRPDAIYNKASDTLFFRKLSSITAVFPGISNLYREATKEETEEFLQMGFISNEGLSAVVVSIPNRKRIAMAREAMKKLNHKQKKQIFKYIAEYCPDICNGENKFAVRNNDDLTLVLYGIEQRFYTTPVGEEKRIANSIIKLPIIEK